MSSGPLTRGHMKIRFPLIIVAGVFSASAFHEAAGAQAPASVLAGVYTADQAKKGAATYAKECAACHGEALTGQDPIPPLQGAAFLTRWKNVGELFEKTSTTMPALAPGSLSNEQ